MRLLLALAVMVVALVAWLAYAPRHSALPSAISDLGSKASSAPAGDRVATELDMPIDASAPTRSVEQPAAKQLIAVAAVAAGSACRVFGRVVDDLGLPIAGARLALQEWGEFPAITVAHEAISADSGGFSFEIAALASTKQSLSITARPFHLPAERWFGDVSEAEGRRLAAGDVDVGTIELRRCGTVEGRVLSDAGVPVADVGVLLKGSQFEARGGTTNANGMYSIAGLQPNQLVVTVEHTEWSPTAKIFVEPVLSRVTTAPDLVLTSTPSIAGVVVDAAGAPIAGIAVEGLAPDGYMTTRTSTAEDGAFVLRLPQGEAVALSVPQTCEYMAFGGPHGDPAFTFGPGARNVPIVLERTPVMTFRVVDAATRAPIERFGLWLTCGANLNPKNAHTGEPAIQDHPGGTVALACGDTARVSVVAVGFAPAEQLATVADPSTPNVQTIALHRGSRITGRVLVSGKAAAEAWVSCAREYRPDEPVEKPWRSGFGGGWNREFEQYAHNSPHVVSDLDGRFEISELAAGTYSLRILAPWGARTLLHKLVVPAGGVLALGDVEIAPEAVVRGVMRTAPGDSPDGATITFDDYREARIENKDGRFEMRGLAAGPHWLVWKLAGEQRNLDSGDLRRVDFVLEAGETRELVIDAAANAPCSVTVVVTRNGSPLANAAVSLKRISDSATSLPDRRALGRTNPAGLVTASVDGGVRGRIIVTNVAKQVIGSSAEEIDFVAGGNYDCAIEVKAGRLVVQVPASIPRPDVGRVVVQIPEGGTLTAYAGRKAQKGPNAFPEWASDVIDFGEVTTVVHTVRITLERYERNPTSDDPKAGRWIELRQPFDADVVIKDGEETRVVVP